MVLEIVHKQIQSEPLFSLSFLRSRIPESLQNQFCQDTRLCLSCGGKIVEQDEETVCSSCGQVWDDGIELETHQIPFVESDVASGHAESSYSPVNSLSFGKLLGSAPLKGAALYRVLGKSRNGKVDIGLRAMQCQIVINKVDHPIITLLLGYASEILKRHGFGDDNTEQNLLWSNTLGNRVRRVGAYLTLRNERAIGEPKRVVGALFVDLFSTVFPERYAELKQKIVQDESAARLYWEIGCTDEEVQYYTRLLWMLTPPAKPKKLKKPKGTNQETA